jgi:hypothetical protein
VIEHILLSEKLRILDECVVSKLVYCLHALWLNAREVRRLNSSWGRCLRKVLHIPQYLTSRVPNQVVLETTGWWNLSDILQQRQIILLAKLEECCTTISWGTESWHLEGLSYDHYRPNKNVQGHGHVGRKKSKSYAYMRRVICNLCMSSGSKLNEDSAEYLHVSRLVPMCLSQGSIHSFIQDR